jgi:hypothetical protein
VVIVIVVAVPVVVAVLVVVLSILPDVVGVVLPLALVLVVTGLPLALVLVAAALALGGRASRLRCRPLRSARSGSAPPDRPRPCDMLRWPRALLGEVAAAPPRWGRAANASPMGSTSVAIAARQATYGPAHFLELMA